MVNRGFQRSALLVIVACSAMAVLATSALAEPRAITFADLPNPAAQTFEDPFREMGFEMLAELRTVVRLEERLETGAVDVDARLRLQERLHEARSVLEAHGHDIQTLLSQRWVVAENRRRARFATNPSLAGENVALTGFLIPGGGDENGERVGYLVAEVGMCSHIPPPPPNQLVRVALPEKLPISSLYEPVRIAGTLRPLPYDTAIFLIDGDVRMVGSWVLEPQAISTIACPEDRTTRSALRRSIGASPGTKAPTLE